MVTMQQLKNETASLVEKEIEKFEGDPADMIEAVDFVLDAFMDVLEAHSGTLKFTAPPSSSEVKTVAVGTAGEDSGVGR